MNLTITESLYLFITVFSAVGTLYVLNRALQKMHALKSRITETAHKTESAHQQIAQIRAELHEIGLEVGKIDRENGDLENQERCLRKLAAAHKRVRF